MRAQTGAAEVGGKFSCRSSLRLAAQGAHGPGPVGIRPRSVEIRQIRCQRCLFEPDQLAVPTMVPGDDLRNLAARWEIFSKQQLLAIVRKALDPKLHSEDAWLAVGVVPGSQLAAHRQPKGKPDFAQQGGLDDHGHRQRSQQTPRLRAVGPARVGFGRGHRPPSHQPSPKFPRHQFCPPRQ